MFEIIYEGEVIGLVEKPRYVRQKNGVWVQCEGKDATAIALKSHAYEGAFAKETDGGEYAFEQESRITANEGDIADTQDALIEATTDIDSRLADIEDALCELTEE